MRCSVRHAWLRCLSSLGPERHLRAWLLDDGSLTARLQGHGQFSVRVLTQGFKKPSADESSRFGLAPSQKVWVREVTLLVDGEALVFAHTVHPATPRGPVTRWLARLGARSLGSMLFSRPGFARGPLSCCQLDHRHRLHGPAAKALGLPTDGPLWARRSLFGFRGQQVLVTEVFSPALLRKPPPVTKTPQCTSP